MTPILFPANTQAGGFTSHGLGNISDAASFLVTEQLNGAYTAAMTVPVDSIRYGDLRLGDTVEVVYERLGVSVRSRVIETVYDTLRDRWQSVKIGDPKITISDTVVETKQAAGAAGGAARRAQDTADQAAFDLAEFLDNLANGTTAANTLVCQYLNIIPSGHTGFVTIGGGGSPFGSNYGPSVKTVKGADGTDVTLHYLGLD